MISSLIIYSSTDGHTKTICERIINFLKDENATKLVSLDEAKDLNLSDGDVVDMLQLVMDRFKNRNSL